MAAIPANVIQQVREVLRRDFVTREEFQRAGAEGYARGYLHQRGDPGGREPSICKLILVSLGRDRQLAGDFGYEREVYSGLQTKALSAGVDAAGGFLVPEEFRRRVIEQLSELIAVRAALIADGGQVIPMVSDTLKTPRGAGAVTADWVAENVDAALSDPGVEQVTLSLKDLIAATQVSNKLVEVSDPAADVFVERRLVRAIAEKESLDFLRRAAGGSGPIGIENIAGVQSFTIAAGAGGEVALGDLEKAEELLISKKFAPPFQWIGNAAIYRRVANFKTADGAYLWERRFQLPLGPDVRPGDVGAPRIARGRVQPLGYDFFFESQLPSNLGVGTNETIFYLTKARHIMIGDSLLGLTLSASREFKFLADALTVKAVRRTDVSLEYPEALVKIVGAKAA